MMKGEQVTGDTQPPPCECQRTEPGRPCGETVAHLHAPVGSPQQPVCKAGPPHAPQESTAFPSLPGLRLPSHRGFWPSRCLLISSNQLQPIAVPWREGGHLLSFNVLHAVPPRLGSMEDGNSQGLGFLKLPCSDPTPHCVHYSCRCNPYGGSGRAPSTGSPGSQQPLPHRRGSPGSLGEEPAAGNSSLGLAGAWRREPTPRCAALPGT